MNNSRKLGAVCVCVCVCGGGGGGEGGWERGARAPPPDILKTRKS